MQSLLPAEADFSYAATDVDNDDELSPRKPTTINEPFSIESIIAHHQRKHSPLVTPNKSLKETLTINDGYTAPRSMTVHLPHLHMPQLGLLGSYTKDAVSRTALAARAPDTKPELISPHDSDNDSNFVVAGVILSNPDTTLPNTNPARNIQDGFTTPPPGSFLPPHQSPATLKQREHAMPQILKVPNPQPVFVIGKLAQQLNSPPTLPATPLFSDHRPARFVLTSDATTVTLLANTRQYERALEIQELEILAIKLLFYSSIEHLAKKDLVVYLNARIMIDNCVEQHKRKVAGYYDLRARIQEGLSEILEPPRTMSVQPRHRTRYQRRRVANNFTPRRISDNNSTAGRNDRVPGFASIETLTESQSADPLTPPTTREVKGHDDAVHKLSSRLGAYQRQLLTNRLQAGHHQPSPIRRSGAAAVGVEAHGGSVTKLASSQWATESLAAMDPLTAFHCGRFLTDDPNPSNSVFVQQMAQRLLDSKNQGGNEVTVTTFVDTSSEIQRKLLLTEIDSIIKGVAYHLEIPADAASLLLHDFNFNMDDAIQSTQADRQGTLDRFGLSLRCSKKRKAPTHDIMRSCGICFDASDEGSQMFGLSCNHDFCVGCWKGYLSSTLQSGLARLLIVVCPSPNCIERFTIDDALQIAPELSHMWPEAYLQAYVNRSRGSRRFCPGPDCTVIAFAPPTIELGLLHSTTCTRCDTCFCMKCGESAHFPATCEDLEAFTAMFGSSALWIKKNTKPCPGCRAVVEKDGGCNAMHCTRCNNTFCWRCLSQVDGKHDCQVSDQELSTDETLFEFFGKRFQAHRSAEQSALERLTFWQQDMPNYLVNEAWFMLHPQDLAMICTALKTLIEAQRFLKNSCAASFSRRTSLAFEMHQAALEASTEGLKILTDVYIQELSDAGGERLIRQHFGMLGLHTLFVRHCLKRMTGLAGVT